MNWYKLVLVPFTYAYMANLNVHFHLYDVYHYLCIKLPVFYYNYNDKQQKGLFWLSY